MFVGTSTLFCPCGSPAFTRLPHRIGGSEGGQEPAQGRKLIAAMAHVPNPNPRLKNIAEMIALADESGFSTCRALSLELHAAKGNARRELALPSSLQSAMHHSRSSRCADPDGTSIPPTQGRSAPPSRHPFYNPNLAHAQRSRRY